MAMEGFFDLQTPEDLLHKLEWEYAQWQGDPLSTYRAWNFFVTAEHLPDWLARTGPRLPKIFGINVFKHDNPLLRICSHLANGGKHFRPRPDRHTSVASTRQQAGWVKPGWVKPGWVELPALIVDLTPDEQQALASPSASVDALSLAADVLTFLQQHLRATAP
jgi:hypothetical protein